MKPPHFTHEQVEWFEQVFDNRPVKSDNKQDLVWKAAQREVVSRVQEIFKQQVDTKRKNLHMGVNLRGDDD